MAKKGTKIRYRNRTEITKVKIPLLTWDDWAKANRKKK